jgi:DNA polymerase-3 subunit epsilon
MIEIAAFRFDGDEVVDQLISLVHPHRAVQPFVSKITGITPKMLARAPRFHELAKRLIEVTKDAVIVGHNVAFDYRMLRQEFARLGYNFERETIDTIPLAEELIPNLKTYGLNSVCEELGIFRSAKHRAEDDARATLELFRILREKDQRKSISLVEQSIQHNDYFKDKINDLKRSVKHNRGIFYLHDRKGNLLYLSGSDNVKAALNRLFVANRPQAKALAEKTHQVKVEAVGNWLVAQIKRHEELDQSKPPFNRRSPLKLRYAVLADERGTEAQFKVEWIESLGRKKSLFLCPDQRSAFRFLRMHRRLKKSQQKEVLKILKDLPEEALLVGRGRKNTERCAFLWEDGQLKGYLYFQLNDALRLRHQIANKLVSLHSNPYFDQQLLAGIFSGEFQLWQNTEDQNNL